MKTFLNNTTCVYCTRKWWIYLEVVMNIEDTGTHNIKRYKKYDRIVIKEFRFSCRSVWHNHKITLTLLSDLNRQVE